MNLLTLAADLARAEHPMNKQPDNFCQTFEIADYQVRLEQDLWALRQLEDAEKYLAESKRLRIADYLDSDPVEQNHKSALQKLESVRSMLEARKARHQ